MTTTVSFSLTDSSWSTLATGPSDVTVQLKSPNPCLLHVGTSAPASDSIVGITLRFELDGIPLPSMTTGDTLYGKAVSGSSVVHVVRT